MRQRLHKVGLAVVWRPAGAARLEPTGALVLPVL